MPFARCIAAGDVLFCAPKENQKGRRCPQGMKAPVGLLSRRPVCKANAACLARQGLRYFRSAGGTNQGLLAPGDPKAVGLHTKNPSRCARGFFVFRRFRGPSAAAAAAPRRGADAAPAVCRPVPSREKRKPENPQIFRLSFYKNNRSAKDAQSEAEGILNRLLPVGITQNDIPPVRSF